MSTVGYVIYLVGILLMIGVIALWAIHYDKTHSVE